VASNLIRPRVLVAGVGNLLQADDGFGVRLAHKLQLLKWPENVTICETGIGGIHLVQELMDGFDVLIVLDAVDRQREPGTVLVIEPDVIDVNEMDLLQKHDMLADMHLATPERAMMVAKALQVLPKRTFILGCQPVTVNRLEIGLHHVVEHALDTATAELNRLLRDVGALG